MKATVGESRRTKPGEEAQLPTVARHQSHQGETGMTPSMGFVYVVYLNDK